MIAFWTLACALIYALAVVCLISATAWALILMLAADGEPSSASGGTVSVGNSARLDLEDTAQGRSREGRSQ